MAGLGPAGYTHHLSASLPLQSQARLAAAPNALIAAGHTLASSHPCSVPIASYRALLAGTLSALGLWAATVVLGLAVFALAVLPATLYCVTG